MPYTDSLKIYTTLRERFEEEEAKVIARAVEEALETNNEVLLGRMATKEDIANMATKEDIANMATKEDIANLRAEFKTDIANLRADLIKWMFLFWIGQAAVVLGIVFTVVKFLK